MRYLNPMIVFRSYTFRWWQLLLYETALFSAGIAVGSIWSETLQPIAPFFILLFLAIAPYIIYLYLIQIANVVAQKKKEFAKKDSTEVNEDV